MLLRNSCSFAIIAILLVACRGGSASPGASALPPGQPAFRASAAAVAATFHAIGPTHMSDGLPTSGKVNAYAIDPANSNTIYVASGRGTGLETYSSAGIYRTTDGGANWQAIDDGLTDASGAISSVINALWLDPSNPQVLLAASEYDGVFRSGNGGTTWKSVYHTPRATQFAAFGNAIYAATAAGILVSTDLGQTWKIAFAASASKQPTAFGSATAKGGALYAGMTDGTVYALGAGGTWTKRGTLPYNRSTGTDGSTPQVHQIAVDPLVPTTLYASSNDGGWDQDLHASTDGGKTWNDVLKGRYYSYGLGTQAIAFSQVHPHLLYVGADGGMYDIAGNGSAQPKANQAANLSVIDIRNIWTVANGNDDACWVASDQGLDYEPACSLYSKHFNDRVVSSTVAAGLARRFTVSPDGSTIVVSLQDFSSHRTSDGGSTWAPKYSLYEDGFNELQPGNPSTCYSYDEASGLGVSTDGCSTYRFPAYTSGIYPSRLMTTPIGFDPKTPQKMYLMAGPIVGFATAKFGAFETANAGQSFTKLPWPFAQPGMIAVDPHDGNHILVGDLKSNQSSISVTFDGGKTWTKSAGVPATPFWYSATISQVNTQTVLASSVDASNTVFALRSKDGGRTFTRAANVVIAPLLRGRADIGERTLRGEQPPAAFVYSPVREIRFNQDVTKGIPYLALTTLRGAFVSTDLGSTWQRVDRALIAHSFWGIRWRNGYLYLASDGQGVVVSDAPVQP